ncbi:Uncharacterised protein [Vibrio cholerae]|nr:Uncharacterised protein [Vibrio cholerae]
MVSSLGSNSHNKRLKRDCQRVAFPVPLSPGGLQLLCLSLVCMRCQPLRRALYLCNHLSFHNMPTY